MVFVPPTTNILVTNDKMFVTHDVYGVIRLKKKAKVTCFQPQVTSSQPRQAKVIVKFIDGYVNRMI